MVTDGKAELRVSGDMQATLQKKEEAGNEGEGRYNTGAESLLLCQLAPTHLGWLGVPSLMAC